METLRGPKTLIRAVPERETATATSGGIRTTLETVENHTGTVHANPLAVNTALPMPADLLSQERFARDFADPLFPQQPVGYAVAKRIFDITVALTMLLIAAPVLLVVALLIKLTDCGPVFFKQVRVGQGGRYFWCYKFRSMCVDAEAKKALLMHLNEASGPVFKIKRDPRVTRIGAFIRKTSLDEFPQLFNVLLGDMSIVGPRPPLPTEVATYNSYQRRRLAVRPGLTCVWQVSGRSNLSFDRWVELDLQYIETMSFTNDLKLVLRTVPAVLKGSGAH